PHDVAERIAAPRAVAGGTRERRREKPEPVPVIELPRGEPGQPRNLRGGEHSMKDPAIEFHACISGLYPCPERKVPRCLRTAFRRGRPADGPYGLYAGTFDA